MLIKSFFKAKLVGVGMLLLAGAGCSTMSKQECKVADWYLVGVEDAQKGQPKSRLDDHRKACAKANITPDIFKYEAGHEHGLKTYCTTQNGYAVAVNVRTIGINLAIIKVRPP
jgi:hypothetical protein